MLVSYRGIVKNGKVEVTDAQLPDGTEVVVVTQISVSSAEEQKRRLAALSDSEWNRPFETYVRILKENPAEADSDTLSDTELNDLLHEARQE
jgi:hypothetical protein